MIEQAATGYYHATPSTALIASDSVTVNDCTRNVGFSLYQPEVNIDSTQAAKALVNKVVQNKSSRVTAYNDDDGKTPILTHTPTYSDANYEDAELMESRLLTNAINFIAFVPYA